MPLHKFLIRRGQKRDGLLQGLRRNVVAHLHLQSLGDGLAETVLRIQLSEGGGQRHVIDEPANVGWWRR